MWHWARLIFVVGLVALVGCVIGERMKERELRLRLASREWTQAIAISNELYRTAQQGGDAQDTVKAGVQLARIHTSAGHYREATEIAERVLLQAERELPETNVLRTDAMFQLAINLQESSRYDEAEQLLVRTISLMERLGSSRNLKRSAAHLELGRLYYNLTRYPEAQAEIAQALSIQETVLGPVDPQLVPTLKGLGEVLRERGELPEARAALDRARIIARSPGDRSSILQALATIDDYEGNSARASEMLEEARELTRTDLGSRHPRFADVTQLLGQERSRQGRHAQARTLIAEALTIYEEHYGKESAEVGVLAYDQATNDLSLGDYASAVRAYERCLEIVTRLFGAESDRVAIAMEGLADAYMVLGRAQDAIDLQQKAVVILEKNLGANHWRVGSMLTSLAASTQARGDLDGALVLYERAYGVLDSALGAQNVATASAKMDAAQVLSQLGRLAEAERRAAEALGAVRTAVEPGQPLLVPYLLSAAKIAITAGRHSSADRLVDEAIRIARQWLNADHPYVYEAMVLKGDLAWAAGNVDVALEAYREAQPLLGSRLGRSLGGLTERAQSELSASLSESMDRLISFSLAAGRGRAAASRIAFESVLHRKSRILETSAGQWAQIRQKTVPGDLALLEELRDLQREIARLAYSSTSSDLDANGRKARLSELGRQHAQLEEALVQRLPLPDNRITTVEQITTSLPSDALLLEFVRYRRQRVEPSGRIKEKEQRYAVFILSSDQVLRWRDLGPSQRIDRAAERFSAVLQTPEDPDLTTRARELDRLILEPIAGLLRGRHHLLVAPDGALNLVPLSALIDRRGRYRVEDFVFTYLNSARDVVHAKSRVAASSPSLVVGAPDFDSTIVSDELRDVAGRPEQSTAGLQDHIQGTSPRQATRSRDFRTGFEQLPGAEAELRDVGRALQVMPVLGPRATEGLLKKARSPRILHIATHAFFLRETKPATRDQAGKESGTSVELAESPLLRSGLALAGANALASGEEDGVLTALEVLGMDLQGTELVVLSACDTGLGEVKTSEGVYGLRRAFAVAGSRSQLLSLWRINDGATRTLVSTFYSRLLSGQGRSAALRNAQLELLKDPVSRSPYFWASFIMTGDWRPLEELTAPVLD